MAKPSKATATTQLRRDLRAMLGEGVSSSLMVGIGERDDEITQLMEDVVDGSSCDILTIGQYLQPTKKHLAVEGFVHPDQFAAYEAAGAAAVSVLADGPGFGGSVLEVRRVAAVVDLPVLFKEFVVDPVQVDFARAAGASLVLLLVRCLSQPELTGLVAEVRAQGMEPVVEAANAEELSRALATQAAIVGVNARDLRSFEVDLDRAARCLGAVPAGRVAVFMSGVRSTEIYARIAETRADAVLIGEGLMQHPDPGLALARLTSGARRR